MKRISNRSRKQKRNDSTDSDEVAPKNKKKKEERSREKTASPVENPSASEENEPMSVDDAVVDTVIISFYFFKMYVFNYIYSEQCMNSRKSLQSIFIKVI